MNLQFGFGSLLIGIASCALAALEALAFGAKSWFVIPLSFALVILFTGRNWTYRTEAVYFLVCLGILGAVFSGAPLDRP